MANDHVQHDVVKRGFLRELFHRAFLAMFVNVLEADPGALRERSGYRPLVIRATEGDTPRLDVDHPFLTEFRRQPLPDSVIDDADDFLEPLHHLLRGYLEFVDEAIDFVDEQYRPHSLLQRLADHRLRLRHDSLDRVVENDHAVDCAHRTGHITSEIHMAGRVDEIDQELTSLEVVDHRCDCGVDRNAASLLLFVEVHEELLACQLLGDHARARDQGIRQCCLSMIHVRRCPNVADALLQVKESLGFLDVLFFSSHRRDTYGGRPVSEVAPDRD